jgi:hypothetical protein
VQDETEKKQDGPILTIEQFDEKTLALNEVYRNNIMDLDRRFMEKQQVLWDRLSKEDRDVVMKRTIERFQEAQRKIQTPFSGLVDVDGRKIIGEV